MEAGLRATLRANNVNCSDDDDAFSFTNPAPFKKGRLRVFVITGDAFAYLREFDYAQKVWHKFGHKQWDLDWVKSKDELVEVMIGKMETGCALLQLSFNEWEGDPPSTRTGATIAVKPEEMDTIYKKLKDIISVHPKVATPSTPSYRGHFLSAKSFRHRVDLQQTKILERVPGLKFVVKSILAPAYEKSLRLELISSSILVGPKQLPHIHKLVLEAAEVLGIPVPQLFIQQSPEVNAYTLAISGEKKSHVVVVHTALVELLTEEELKTVIAHEMGHLACDHGVWVTAWNMMSLGIDVLGLVPGIALDGLKLSLRKWDRAAELSADRAALLVVGDPKIVVSVLMKLSGGSSKLSESLNVDAFMEQARSYDMEKRGVLGSFLSGTQIATSTHPLPVYRAREIDTWSRSDHYKSLIATYEDKRHVLDDA